MATLLRSKNYLMLADRMMSFFCEQQISQNTSGSKKEERGGGRRRIRISLAFKEVKSRLGQKQGTEPLGFFLLYRSQQSISVLVQCGCFSSSHCFGIPKKEVNKSASKDFFQGNNVCLIVIL